MDSRQKRKQEHRRRKVVEGTVILVIFLVAVLAMRKWLPMGRDDLFHSGEGSVELTGCGPTCLSMVLCGLTQSAKYDPAQVARLADRWGYYAEGRVTVHDPNSRARSERGWELDELMPQIKNLWSFEKST